MFAMASRGFFEIGQTVCARFILPSFLAEICDGGLRLEDSARV